MSMPIRNRKKSREVIRKVWCQLFGIVVRKARENSVLSLEAIANLAGMDTQQWLAMEAGEVPDPSRLELMAAVLNLNPEQMAKTVLICRAAWE